MPLAQMEVIQSWTGMILLGACKLFSEYTPSRTEFFSQKPLPHLERATSEKPFQGGSLNNNCSVQHIGSLGAIKYIGC